ncbi:hypothetical protein BC936DRAFT_144636 [Jimgerdemannia flammicorona]|uniref:Homeodomain-like protein n=1 Tax=Jimgerdemannia flammicorona TaxID=994334 RepID=A0A433DMJ5_9FUNG|nr:hypothetical protein BC936DRAFT_144636 [Jimgerdemannia flammicorona]
MPQLVFGIAQRTIVRLFDRVRFLTTPAFSYTRQRTSNRWSDAESRVLSQKYAELGAEWDTISRSIPGRTPDACSYRSRFLGLTTNLALTKSTTPVRWTEEDDQLLRKQFGIYGRRWTFLATRFFPNRSDFQLSSRWKTTLKDKSCGKWTSEESERLKIAVAKYGVSNWVSVARDVNTRTACQCRAKIYASDSSVKKGRFTKAEDDFILAAYNRYKGDWIAIADDLYKVFGHRRISKQCVSRYYNYLNPELVKGPYTLEEQEALIGAYYQYEGRLCEIARALPQRSYKMHEYQLEKLKRMGRILPVGVKKIGSGGLIQ